MKKEFRNRSIMSRLLFSRFAITVLLLLIELGLLISLFLWLGEYANYIFGGLTVLSVVVIVYILNNRENPSYKLSWILLVALLPIMGSFLYLFVKTNIGTIGQKRRLVDVLSDTREFGMTGDKVREELKKEPADFGKMAEYIERAGGYAAYKNTGVEYYPLGEVCFAAMKAELEKAKSFIFMEYFIIEEGTFWDSILEILERKAEEGVEVRVMYDDLGCVALLPRNYIRTLKSKGIQAKAFSQLKPFLSTHYNNRDHRKILVIDGLTAMNGGINLADEYINEKQLFGHWKDNAYRVRGDAVSGYTHMFLQLWNSTGEINKEDYKQYIEVQATRKPRLDDGYVIPFGDGPHQEECVAENVYMDIIHGADDYVYMMSPYLILDNEMLQTILHAAKRGVRVKLLLPHVPDKWFAIVIARSYYPLLIDAGVEVYQYTPGFVHAKMFLSDDKISVVGTINLDFRSLYLHYECGGLFYKGPVISEIKKDFDAVFSVSQRMTLTKYKKMRLIDRLAGRILRLIGPLM